MREKSEGRKLGEKGEGNDLLVFWGGLGGTLDLAGGSEEEGDKLM